MDFNRERCRANRSVVNGFLLPQFNQYIIDHVIPNKSTAQLVIVVGLLLLTVTISGIFTYISTYYMGS